LRPQDTNSIIVAMNSVFIVALATNVLQLKLVPPSVQLNVRKSDRYYKPKCAV